jgi:hypothetical protein
MSIRNQYAQQIHHPLPEVDVFCGQIFNRTGMQTRRQRDAASKLRDDSTRNTDWLVRQIQSGGDLPTTTISSSLTADDRYSVDGGVPLGGGGGGGRGGGRFNRQALELALACLFTTEMRKDFPECYTGDGLGSSFKIVAACCLIRELAALREAWRQGGGLGDDDDDDEADVDALAAALGMVDVNRPYARRGEGGY